MFIFIDKFYNCVIPKAAINDKTTIAIVVFSRFAKPLPVSHV
jgi:hypothetical protein